MIRDVSYRCVVQRNNTLKDKYYPAIVQGSTNEQLSSESFTSPTCDVEIITNTSLGTSGYSSPIRTDDIIRIQVSTKMNPLEKSVWQDLFEGTIEEIEGTYGTKNTSSLHCVGHIDEATWTEIEETKSWTSTTDAQTVFQYILSTKGYHRRLTYNSSYCQSGITFSNYNTTINQTFLEDVIAEMEKYSGYLYRGSAIPTYDSNGNLSTVYFSWKPVSTLVTDKYKIIEGTSRYINSDFAASEEDLRNRYTVIGSTTSSYKATYSNASSISIKGKRTKIDTYTWINSANQCTSIANGVGADIDDPTLYGSALLIGTPEARPGDLVYCKSPSQEVNGSTVNANMTVNRVVHRFGNIFTTAVDLNRIKKTAYDYIGIISKETNTCKKNIVKCS